LTCIVDGPRARRSLTDIVSAPAHSHLNDGNVARLIALEGIDGSGKGTQAARLVAALAAQGASAALLGFPRYQETFFGARIGEFLNGRFGSLDAVDPFLAALLFAGDRFESRARIAELAAAHDYLVLDRYVASNIAHQAAKRSGAEREALAAAIRHLEFEVYRLPPADRTIWFDLPAEIAAQLVARKSRRDYTAAAADLQEADLPYQRSVAELYRALCDGDRSWRRVPVLSAKGELRAETDIAADVLQAAIGA